ncbi:hypothetical protein BH20ACT4_BH20ACT4_01730 [soil metagenome]
MATPSLYRRYRPRRFSELKGQDHVVRALREAVRSGREGQAYLFSGPRGTGKTTSARILAKVLNCQSPIDGEPCCECESCLAVEQGTSYDVHELDAASNNGVDAMRDLIERASLGTPGRHKVYILDEVHMLSRAAEAALLKTLEEPPDHVVFVLATTDPQKVSETIRSRTQHLRFHLLPADTLADHVRWIVEDAGLQVSEHAIGMALTEGRGSPRDTLSALELLVASGDDDEASAVSLDEFVEALTASDAGQALTVVARAMSLGDEARTLTDRLVRHLRDGFLSLMAPQLVQLPAERMAAVTANAQALGAPRLVRAIEVLGEVLVEMRHAPDPRVLLDVAVVRLCGVDAAPDQERWEQRLSRLERAVDAVVSGAATAPPPPRTSDSGRATVGGRARRPADPRPEPAAGTPDSPDAASPGADTPTVTATDAVAVSPEAVAAIWTDQLLPSLRPLPRALFTTGSVTGASTEEGHIVVALPGDHLRDRCEEHRAGVEALLAAALGGPVTLALTSKGDEPAAKAAVPADDDIDPDGLVDALGHHDPLAHLTDAFPGSEVIADPGPPR